MWDERNLPSQLTILEINHREAVRSIVGRSRKQRIGLGVVAKRTLHDKKMLLSVAHPKARTGIHVHEGILKFLEQVVVVKQNVEHLANVADIRERVAIVEKAIEEFCAVIFREGLTTHHHDVRTRHLAQHFQQYAALLAGGLANADVA